MDFFTIISLASLAFIAYTIHKNPKKWLSTIQYLPIIGFMLYARIAGMTDEAWVNAFNFGGLCAAIVVLVQYHYKFLMDRIYLGINLFLFAGACGFLFDIDRLIEWYSASKGGPFFACIVIVGLLATLFTKTGFMNKKGMSKSAVQYASFVLLGASIIALIWSTQTDDQGLFYSVIAPFIALIVLKEKLEKHVA